MLRELRQYSYYEGLLEGVPTRERNRAHLERIIDRERTKAASVHLIEPVETPIKLGRVVARGRERAY